MTKEEKEKALWDTKWAINTQRMKLDAAVLALTGVGGRGVAGIREEIATLEHLLIVYEELEKEEE